MFSLQYLKQDCKFHHSSQWRWYCPGVCDGNLEEEGMKESVPYIQEGVWRVIVVVVPTIIQIFVASILIILGALFLIAPSRRVWLVDISHDLL